MKMLSINDYHEIKREMLNSDSKKLISFVNPFSYYDLKSMPIRTDFDGFFSDGSLLCLLYNLFNKEKISRVSFDYSSIADDFIRFCAENNLKISIIGARQSELELAIRVFSDKYKNLKFGVNCHGYFFESDLPNIVKSVRESDVVIVAMGAPMQEIIAHKLSQENKHKLVITCGGFITQTSIKDDFYHPLIKKTGLRWLQRLIFQKHVRRKVFQKYPAFCIRYIYENIVKSRAS